MTPPTDTAVFESKISTYWMDKEGILISLSKSPKRTLANTSENFALVRRITNNKKVPLLVYICNSPVPDKETRKFVTKELPHVYTAMAMVSDSGLGKIIMNVLFKFNPPAIPMKSFSDDKKAKEWLRQYL